MIRSRQRTKSRRKTRRTRAKYDFTLETRGRDVLDDEVFDAPL